MSHLVPPVKPPPSSSELIFDDGEPMESGRHVDQMVLLIQTLDAAWLHRDDFFVAGNMFVYFSELQAKKNDFRGPDVFVVLGTERKERKGWVVWEEDGKTPDVVIELISPSTEHVDRGDKMRIYAKVLKVGEYFLFDPWTGVLEGYELDLLTGEYRRKEADAEGRLPCRQLGLSLGKVKGTLSRVEAEWLRWIDADGRPLPTGEERAADATERANAEAERANAEAERANAEAERANAEAARAARLAVELAALKEKGSG